MNANTKLANLYLHPALDVADAAIVAYVNHGHLVGPTGRVRIVPGQDPLQYEKALKARSLRRIATALRQ